VTRSVITNNAMESQGMSGEVEKCFAAHDQRHPTNREFLGGDREVAINVSDWMSRSH